MKFSIFFHFDIFPFGISTANRKENKTRKIFPVYKCCSVHFILSCCLLSDEDNFVVETLRIRNKNFSRKSIYYQNQFNMSFLIDRKQFIKTRCWTPWDSFFGAPSDSMRLQACGVPVSGVRCFPLVWESNYRNAEFQIK